MFIKSYSNFKFNLLDLDVKLFETKQHDIVVYNFTRENKNVRM